MRGKIVRWKEAKIVCSRYRRLAAVEIWHGGRVISAVWWASSGRGSACLVDCFWLGAGTCTVILGWKMLQKEPQKRSIRRGICMGRYPCTETRWELCNQLGRYILFRRDDDVHVNRYRYLTSYAGSVLCACRENECPMISQASFSHLSQTCDN